MSHVRALASAWLTWLLITPAYAAPPVADAAGPTTESVGRLTPEAQRQAWLSSKLIGGDNRMAARRLVQIENRDGRHSIFIKNQFALRCSVEFDAAGDPTRLTECKSGDNAEWDAKGPITLTCREQRGGRICSGKWYSKNGIIAPDTLSFQRSNGMAGAKAKANVNSYDTQRPPGCPKGARCAVGTVVSDF
jgi:hypothetical protein